MITEKNQVCNHELRAKLVAHNFLTHKQELE
jgi:hypothetical protein